MKNRLTRGVLALGVAVVLGPVLASCSTATNGGSAGARGRVPSWDEDATPASVSKQPGVEIPAAATDRRAAYQNGFQDDGLLPAFSLSTSEVEAFVTGPAPQGELTRREKPLRKSVKPTTPFSHLGLAEPETLPDVQEGQIRAPCEGRLNSLQIAVHPLDDRAGRVYLRGVG
ncbi:hypothetical protein ACFRCX_25730 [Streptomyces sp. NPDC056652]|uniref:hypothetical protein n=1 Tax=Streptomyces sp. NPDC056652 TaxID=3345893 RepID=UPI0036900831